MRLAIAAVLADLSDTGRGGFDLLRLDLLLLRLGRPVILRFGGGPSGFPLISAFCRAARLRLLLLEASEAEPEAGAGLAGASPAIGLRSIVVALLLLLETFGTASCFLAAGLRGAGLRGSSDLGI